MEIQIPNERSHGGSGYNNKQGGKNSQSTLDSEISVGRAQVSDAFFLLIKLKEKCNKATNMKRF